MSAFDAFFATNASSALVSTTRACLGAEWVASAVIMLDAYPQVRAAGRQEDRVFNAACPGISGWQLHPPSVYLLLTQLFLDCRST